MKYKVTHKTEYEYTAPVNLCHNLSWLFPANTKNQNTISCKLTIDPTPDYYSEHTDYFGNNVAFFSIQKMHQVLNVTMESEVELSFTPSLSLDFSNSITWEEVAEMFKVPKPEWVEMAEFRLESPLVKCIAPAKAYALASFTPGRNLVEACHELMTRINADFKFVPGFTTISTPLEIVFHEKKGVCQDFAHVGIACLRSLGLPARYMSGYIETLPPPGKEKLVGADASHAWFSVFVPHTGWIDFDPTNNQIPREKHIVVGWGRDYSDVTPLKGVIYNSGNQELKIAVDVVGLS